MKKLFLLIIAIIYLFFSQLYPFRLWKMEGDNLFVMTSDFNQAVLTSPAGLAEWIGLWVSQAYDQVILGIIIHTTLLTLIALASYQAFRRSGFHEGALGCFVWPVATTIGASFYGHSPVMLVSQLVLWSSIALYLSISRTKIRTLLSALLMPLLFFLLPGGMLILFYAGLAIHEIRIKQAANPWLYLVYPVISLFLPALWNQFFFLPLESRYTLFTHADVPSYLAILSCIPLFLCTVHIGEKIQLRRYWAYVLAPFILIGTAAILALNPTYQKLEESHHLDYLADNGMWKRLVQRCREHTSDLNDLHLKYATLALIEQNKLPELIFTLPVTPIFEYTYPAPDSRMTYTFNARFYQALHLTNEAMHCLFQDACMSDYGMNFRDLENLVRCARISGNMALANKYLALWAQSNRSAATLTEFMQKEYPVLTGLPQEFISSSDRNTLLRILSSNFSTPIINDCLLCNLLIHKDLETFGKIAPICLAQSSQLRGCYEEAVILCKIKNIPCPLQVSDNTLRAYKAFQTLMDTGQLEQIEHTFTGSYWKYYYSELSE